MPDLTPGGPAARIGDGNDRFRRALGIAVLAGLLLLSGVLVGVRGRVVPGDPVAAPVAAPPRVGDCVTGNPRTPPGDGQAFIAPLRSLPIGGCAGPRFGEVVGVGAGYRPSIQIPQGASTSAWSRRTATWASMIHRGRACRPGPPRRSGFCWSDPTSGNAPPGRTGRPAWWICRSRSTRRRRPPWTTRCRGRGTGRRTADCSRSAWMIRTP
jgi:hypothetical protein